MKKWISIILSITMFASLMPVLASANEESKFTDVSGSEYYSQAADALSDLDILEGYDNGSFGASRSITRAEMAAVICRMLDEEKNAEKASGKTEFDDVNADHWASGYINIATDKGIIEGDGDGGFRPEDNVKYEEAIKMVVCALGLGDDVKVDPENWSAEYLRIANDNKITNDLKGSKGNASTRGDVAVMVYNGLTKDLAAPTASKAGGTYTGTQKIELTTSTKDAVIYYTTDGSAPTAKSTKYTSSISITKTSTLRAVAVLKDVLVSDEFKAEYTVKSSGGGGGGGGGGSSSSKAPEIFVNNFSETESNNVDTETISVEGTSKAYSGSISKIEYSLRFALEDTASISGEAEGTTQWSISDIPLRVGTSFLTITATDSKNKTVSKEITINRLSTEIELAENVILYNDEETAYIVDGIIDYWVDDMGTSADTYDDQINVLFAENSDIVQGVKNGNINTGDVLMLQPCDALYLGFNGVFVSNKEPEDSIKYNTSEYEVLIFTSADFTDVFAGDVSLSYELANVDNPIAFAYFPSEVEIYSMDDNGMEQMQLYSNINDLSIATTEGYGDQTPKQEIKNAGFQKNAISYMMDDALNVTGGLSSDNGMNIGLKFRDAVLFDADGSADTTNDQFKFGGSISYNNFKVKAGIEWHPNFNPFDLDLLPQQVIGKYSYTEEIDAHADWTGELSLDDIEVTDAFGNKTKGLVKIANKALNNDFENNKQFMGMTLSGVDMSDSIILGAFGLQISPTSVAPIVGIKNAQYSSVFTPLSAILVIMPVVDVNGKISAKVGFTYKYSAYHEKGINMQKKDYVGAYGTLNDNKGQTSINLPFDRSLEIYNVCSKSSTDKTSDPAWSVTLKGEGKAEEKIALGADMGLMIAGIMPTAAEVKLYEKGELDLTGQLKVDNENGFSADGSYSADVKLGVMAGVHFKLSAKSAVFSPEIKGDKEWDKVLWEIGITSASIDGTVYKADTDTDDTNNEKLKDVEVTLTRTDKQGEPTVTTTTDIDGHYGFSSVLEGKYKISFKKNGYDSYETDVITMSASDKTQNAYLTPETHSTLSGKVTEADSDTDTTNNSPLSGVSVFATLINGSASVREFATTSSDGTYSIPDLPVGLYSVTFEKDGYISTTQTFEVAEGVENYYNTIIESISNEHSGKGTASGTISDYLTGEGVEGLTLNIRNGIGTKTGTIVSTISSGSNGKYATGDLEAGSYTIEIVDNRANVDEKYLTNYFNIKVMGNMNIGNQNGAVGTGLVGDQLRIVLRWGSQPLDLDSHLVGPTSGGSKFHTYFNNQTYYEENVKIADLDLDDTTSWGPETTTIYNPVPGTYKFCIHDYSNRYDSSNTELSNSGAIVQVYRGISVVPEYELYVPRGKGTVWNVFEYNSETSEINVINTITHQESASYVGIMSIDDNATESMNIFDDVYIELTK